MNNNSSSNNMSTHSLRDISSSLYMDTNTTNNNEGYSKDKSMSINSKSNYKILSDIISNNNDSNSCCMSPSFHDNKELSKQILLNTEIIENSINQYIQTHQQQKDYVYVSTDHNIFNNNNGNSFSYRTDHDIVVNSLEKTPKIKTYMNHSFSHDRKKSFATPNNQSNQHSTSKNSIKELGMLGPPPLELIDEYRKYVNYILLLYYIILQLYSIHVAPVIYICI
jgi:hypothetical protein